LVCSGDERGANGIRSKRPVVDVIALDQEIRQAGPPSEEPELPPEAPGDEIEVQAADSLPFDDRAATHGVVADAQSSHLNVDPESQKRGGDAAGLLARVRHNPHTCFRVAPGRRTTCNETEDLRPLLALSRSESA
jgi:hypothetical protein